MDVRISHKPQPRRIKRSHSTRQENNTPKNVTVEKPVNPKPKFKGKR
jgi:hypothetical protein